MFVFPHTFLLLCKFTFPIFRQLYGFLLHPKYLRNPWSWKACVFLCFSCTIEIYFSYVWGVGWISVSPILFEKPITFKCLFFPYFSRSMRIHFSHVLGIVLISEIFKKPITLECLCFPTLFPYYGSSLFPCFGNYMDFCFTRNVQETQNLEMFLFSRTFPLQWQFSFPMLSELYGFLFDAK